MRFIPFIGIGVALAFLYMTFEPLIWSTLNDLIYFPLYGAIWLGLGVTGMTVISCAVLCAAGLYAFLAVTKPRIKMGGER